MNLRIFAPHQNDVSPRFKFRHIWGRTGYSVGMRANMLELDSFVNNLE